MKKFSILLSSLLILALVSLNNAAYAQTAGPSDATTAPPVNATDVGKVLCSGQSISISGPQDVGGVDFASYQWYKMDASGNPQLVAGMTGRTYTEASTTAGYYNYEVVTVNASGCSSPVSDVFKVYVLPPLSVTITASSASVCAGATATPTLTANPTPATPYVLNYQWTLAGTNIAGATSATYTIPVDNNAETLSYGVTVTYALDPTCGPATATQSITINPLPTKPTITAN